MITIFFGPVIVKCKEKNPDITKPCYNEHISPAPLVPYYIEVVSRKPSLQNINKITGLQKAPCCEFNNLCIYKRPEKYWVFLGVAETIVG